MMDQAQKDMAKVALAATKAALALTTPTMRAHVVLKQAAVLLAMDSAAVIAETAVEAA